MYCIVTRAFVVKTIPSDALSFQGVALERERNQVNNIFLHSLFYASEKIWLCLLQALAQTCQSSRSFC